MSDGNKDDPTRRNVIKKAGATAGAVTVGGLAGCSGGGGGDGGGGDGGGSDGGDGGSDGGDGGGGSTPSDGGGGGGQTVNYWGISTTFPKSWQPFQEATGHTIEGQTAPWRQGKVINKMVRGSAAKDYDVVNMDVTITRPVAEQGAIVNMDLESLPDWGDTYDESVKESNPTATDFDELGQKWNVDAEAGDQWAMNTVQNGDSVGYLPEKIGDPSTVNSYGVLFDDEFNGRTSLEAGWATAFPKVANYLKYNNMADIPKDEIRFVTKNSMDKVYNFLSKQKEDGQFRTFWSGWESAVNLLASKDVWAMGTWEPVVFELRSRDINAKYLDPKEGWSLWGESPWLTTGAVEDGKRQAVRDLVNWMIGGYYGASMIKLRGYLPPSPNGIDYAKNHEDYDGEFHEKRHKLVRKKLNSERAVYGYNFPSAERFQYAKSRWSRLSG